MSADRYPCADVVLCPNGPMLLRGDHVVTGEDGQQYATTRPVSAVCRCGHTATTPWCDGTHKLVPGAGPPRRSTQKDT
jgi:CDGSH-type Zn-finger protein